MNKHSGGRSKPIFTFINKPRPKPKKDDVVLPKVKETSVVTEPHKLPLVSKNIYPPFKNGTVFTIRPMVVYVVDEYIQLRQGSHGTSSTFDRVGNFSSFERAEQMANILANRKRKQVDETHKVEVKVNLDVTLKA